MCKEQTHLGSGDAHTGGVGIQKLFLALKRAALIFDSKTFSDLRWVSGARQAGEEQGKERRSLLRCPSPRWSKRTWWSAKLASKIISSIARSVVTFSSHALTIEVWFLPISLAKFRVIFLLLALFVFFVHCQNNFSIDSLCERDWIEPMTSRKREGGWPLRQWCLWPRLQFCSPFSFRRRWSLSLKTGTSSWSPRTGPPASGTTLTVTFKASSFNFQAPFVPQLVMAYSSFLGGELLLYQLCLLSLLDPFPHLLASAEHSNPLNPSSAWNGSCYWILDRNCFVLSAH